MKLIEKLVVGADQEFQTELFSRKYYCWEKNYHFRFSQKVWKRMLYVLIWQETNPSDENEETYF